MREFRALLWDTKVTVNKEHQYLSNEILVHYLNAQLDYLKPVYDQLQSLHTALLPLTGSSLNIERDQLNEIQKLLISLEKKRRSLPPFNLSADKAPIEISRENVLGQLEYFTQWVGDVLRVRRVYGKLLIEYIHSKHTFLSPQEMAVQVERYLQTEDMEAKPYYRLGAPQPVSLSCEIHNSGEDGPVICDSYTFDSLGAFLYLDFFHGLKSNYLPQKCAHCKQWFLLPHGQYSDFCNNLTFRMGKTETCRSIGAREKYNHKCKTDPVWLAYNRAYKAHYARFMKGKISRSAFDKWGKYAVGLRTKALAGKLDFKEYQRLLKE